MKRIKYVILILMFLFSFGVLVKADSANWEFLPLGINYLDNNNFSYTKGEEVNEGCLNTINYIRVKCDTNYYLYFYCYQEGQFNNVSVIEFDEKKNSLGYSSVSLSGEANDASFKTKEETKYIKINFEVEEEYGAMLSLWNVEENYLLCDHVEDINKLSLNDLKYKGAIIDYSPVISGYNGYIEVDIANPINLSTILSGVKVIDDVDGDISDEIIVVNDNYSSNKEKIGTYNILLKAVDSSDNGSEFTIFVEVKDKAKPYLKGDINYSVSSTDNYELSYFLSRVLAYDDYDKDVANKIVVVSDNYSSNKNKKGTYKVVCYVVDSSLNRFDFTITIDVSFNDVTAPKFTGKFSYTTDVNTTITISKIISNISVSDDSDGDLTNMVEVIEDYYSYAPGRVGTFEILLQVKDSSGNKANQVVIINVLDKVAPVFYLNTQVINIDLTNKTYEISDFIEMLERTRAVKKDCNYSVTYDEYSENKNKEGTYQVVLDVDGEMVSLVVEVRKQEVKKNTTLFKKVVSFISDRIIYPVISFFKKFFSFR
mgnify:CR=1 FL=1